MIEDGQQAQDAEVVAAQQDNAFRRRGGWLRPTTTPVGARPIGAPDVTSPPKDDAQTETPLPDGD